MVKLAYGGAFGRLAVVWAALSVFVQETASAIADRMAARVTQLVKGVISIPHPHLFPLRGMSYSTHLRVPSSRRPVRERIGGLHSWIADQFATKIGAATGQRLLPGNHRLRSTAPCRESRFLSTASRNGP